MINALVYAELAPEEKYEFVNARVKRPKWKMRFEKKPFVQKLLYNTRKRQD